MKLNIFKRNFKSERTRHKKDKLYQSFKHKCTNRQLSNKKLIKVQILPKKVIEVLRNYTNYSKK